MTATKKRLFRIERYAQPLSGSGKSIPLESSPSGDDRLVEAIDELKRLMLEQKQELKAIASNQQKTPNVPHSPVQESFAVEELRKERKEAEKLKIELKEIYDAIELTKREILTIHQSGVNGMEMSRVSDELGAIVTGTEKATEDILAAAEEIDNRAGNLSAALISESQQNMACDIQDNVVKIFEACNFQDLTGQRITKVIRAFLFVEQRVIKMMEIWGGIESFENVTPQNLPHRKGDGELLNGPALESDADIASQADIDALFD